MESELKGFVFNHGISPTFANHKKFDLFGSQKGIEIHKCFPTAKAISQNCQVQKQMQQSTKAAANNSKLQGNNKPNKTAVV